MPTQFKIIDTRLLRVSYLQGKLPSESESSESATVSPSRQDESEISVDFTCKTKYEKEKRVLKVMLAVSTRGEKPSYSLEAEMGGSFELDSDPDKDELDRLMYINCPAIVFPFLREYVADLTRRAGTDIVYLPPVNFVRMYKSEQAKAKDK